MSDHSEAFEPALDLSALDPDQDPVRRDATVAGIMRRVTPLPVSIPVELVTFTSRWRRPLIAAASIAIAASVPALALVRPPDPAIAADVSDAEALLQALEAPTPPLTDILNPIPEIAR